MVARKLWVGCLALVILARAVHCLYVDAGLCAVVMTVCTQSDTPLSDPNATDPNESGCLCKGALVVVPDLLADMQIERQIATLATFDLTPSAIANVAQFEPTLEARVCPPPLSAGALRALRACWQI